MVLKDIKLSPPEIKIVLYALPFVFLLIFFNIFLALRNADGQQKLSEIQVSPNTTEEYGLLDHSSFASEVDECRWDVMACDQQFKDNKTLACGLGRSQLIDALLTRDESPCKGRDRAYVEQQAELACTRECPPPTATPRPTATPTPRPTNTPIPQQLTPTPTTIPDMPTATPTPLSPPTATPTQPANTLTISFELGLPGIGTDPESNPNPTKQSRSSEVIVMDSSGLTIQTLHPQVTYQSSGKYTGSFQIPKPTSQIQFKAKLENTLYKKFNTSLSPSQTTFNHTLDSLTLVSGDLNLDNTLDIADYNLILACFRNEAICTDLVRSNSDFNDSGSLYADDFNILLKGFFTPQGELRLLF